MELLLDIGQPNVTSGLNTCSKRTTDHTHENQPTPGCSPDLMNFSRSSWNHMALLRTFRSISVVSASASKAPGGHSTRTP